MRFALLGDHPDGLAMSQALVRSGRHELVTYSGPGAGKQWLEQAGVSCRRVGDLEEVLADPAIELVIVAGTASVRAAQLRRALQSERHVLCVHPADQTPDIAYEAAMIQGDTRRVLMPLLPELVTPAFLRLRQLVRAGPEIRLQWLEIRRLVGLGGDGEKASQALVDWNVLRALGGEIAEVSGYAPREEYRADQPVLVGGNFERGGFFQVTTSLHRESAGAGLVVWLEKGSVELTLPTGWRGAAQLRWQMEGIEQEERLEAGDPWGQMVEVVEQAIQRAEQSAAVTAKDAERGADAPGRRTPVELVAPTWQTEIRWLELEDALRRSVEKRRAVPLEYQEATEEASFKGTMTLVGCGLLWMMIFLLILSRWVPWVGWLISPLLLGFLVLQVLRWIVPRPEERK